MTRRHVEPSAPRFRVEQEGGFEQIIIPARRNPFVLVFLSIWLTGWTMGGVVAITQLLTRFDLFLVVWLIGWALGWVFAAATVL